MLLGVEGFTSVITGVTVRIGRLNFPVVSGMAPQTIPDDLVLERAEGTQGTCRRKGRRCLAVEINGLGDGEVAALWRHRQSLAGRRGLHARARVRNRPRTLH
jgi:hypothetical protein